MSFKTRILHFWQWQQCGAMRRWSRGCGIKALKRTWAGRITNSVLTQSSKIFILNFRYLGWRDVAWVLFCCDYTLTHHLYKLQQTKRLHSGARGKKSVFKCSIVNCKFSKWKVPGDGAVTSFDGSRNHNTAALNNTTTSLHTVTERGAMCLNLENSSCVCVEIWHVRCEIALQTKRPQVALLRADCIHGDQWMPRPGSSPDAA